MAILCVLEGVRPEAPTFAATRGYTTGLWEVTTSCWQEGPSDRPTVDYVLTALKSAAGGWKPKHGALAILSPQDDQSTTPAEEQDSPIASEHQSEPPTTTSVSLDTFQPPVPTVPYHPERSATVDSRILRPSNDTAKTSPNTSPTAASIHSQRASSTRPTPDEILDRLSVRAKSPLEEGEAQKVVDALEKVSRGYPLPTGQFT